MGLLIWIIFGLFAGFIARMLVPSGRVDATWAVSAPSFWG